jgi:hypothetical protein
MSNPDAEHAWVTRHGPRAAACRATQAQNTGDEWKTAGDVAQAHDLFQGMPGLPQERADVAEIFIISWAQKCIALTIRLSP